MTGKKYQGFCPECDSDDWDWANVGIEGAILCVNCGHVYPSLKQDHTPKEEGINK